MSEPENPPYADFIKALPLADLPMSGVTPYLLAAPKGQVVFFELAAGAKVPPHSHGPQWSIIVDGEIEITISGKTRIYTRGDVYSIGDGEVHSARVLKPTRALDVFSDPDRYQAKK